MLKLANLRTDNQNNNTTSNIIHGGLALGGAGLSAYSFKNYKDADENRKQLEREVDLHKQVYDFHTKKIEELKNKKRELKKEWDEVNKDYWNTVDKKHSVAKKLRELTDEVIKADPSKRMDRLLYETHYNLHQATLEGLNKRLEFIGNQDEEYDKLIEEHESKARNAQRKMKTENFKLETELPKIKKAKALGALGAGLALYGTYKLIKNNT